MGKRYSILGLVLLALLLLSGCRMRNIEELYQLPQQSGEHIQLQQEIDRILQSGAEYSAPVSGGKRQSVQYVDIDGDGVNEAVVFFHDPNGDKPLNICILQEDEDTFKVVDIIQEEGTAIDCFDYADLNGDGVVELIIGWRMSDILLMTVYDMRGFVSTMLFQDSYSRYLIHDLTGNGLEELILISDDGASVSGEVSVYTYDAADEVHMYKTMLSRGMERIDAITAGRIQAWLPAVVVDGSIDGGMVSDVIIWRDGSLENITRGIGGVSRSTQRSLAVNTADIDQDGKLEIPIPVPLLETEDGISAYYAMQWYNIDKSGGKHLNLTTYHNFTDGWFLEIPEYWLDYLAVRRDDSVAGERAVIFSAVNKDRDETLSDEVPDTVEDFMIIYALAGDNKEDRAALPGRVIVAETEDTIYAMKILKNLGDLALTEQNMKGSFNLIVSRWES